MTAATRHIVFNSQFLHKHTRNNNICTTFTTKINNVNGNVKSRRSEFLPPLSATLKKKTKKLRKDNDEEEEEEEEGIIPEVVTNKMISRMGFSAGIPLGIGLFFFPFFSYLKVGLHNAYTA